MQIKKNDSIKYIRSFWNRSYRFFFGIFTLFIFTISIFFWYDSLYKSAWSNQEREEYITSKKSGVTLKEDDFYKALDIIENRSINYHQEKIELKDIFIGY